jgi:uncharacterized lipoprotein YehR (DUF1307 family)
MKENNMKKTLITIALTAVVLLTVIGIISSPFLYSRSAVMNDGAYALPGAGGGGSQPEYYAEPSVAEAPVFDAALPMDISKSVELVSNTVADVNRLVIKNADLAIVVKDPKADMTRISKLASEMGGYVVSSNLYQSFYGPNNAEVPEATITIRVPADKLDEVLGKIKENAVDVDYENVSGVDVTSEYVDLQSRLTAKQAAEKKLLQILDKAENSEDVLAIYMQVQSVQTEIEMLKGQIKYYEESAALSAVSIRLIAEAGTQPLEVGGWKIEGTAKESIQNLIFFLQGVTQFLIKFFLNYLWRILLIGLLFYIAFRGGQAIFRRFNKSKVVVETKEEVKK